MIYVVDVGGYTGASVCIEVGFAYALGKCILMAELPNEAAVVAMANEVVSTGEFLQRYGAEPDDRPKW